MMWTGLFYSRAMLSIGLAAFVAASLLCVPFRELWADFRRDAYLKSLSLLFLIPLATGLWSEDGREWASRLFDKSALLLLPFCSASLDRIQPAERRTLSRLCLAVAMVSVLGVSIRYLWARSDIDASYLAAKVMRVDMGDDHVRYGWVLALVFAWLLHLVADGKALSRARERNAALACLLALAAFLHLLSSRTGLMGMYLSVLVFIAFHRRRPLARLLALLALSAPAVAWLLLPTFRNRMRFAVWDFQNFSRGGYVEGLSDTPRVLSLEGGLRLVGEQPWLGTGFGDLKGSMWQWYATHHHYLKDYERLLPSNEFLLHAAAAGLPAAALFTAVALLPFLLKGHRGNAMWVCFHAVAVAGFLYEIGLETQYGIFVYAFLGILLHRRLRAKGAEPTAG